MLQLAPSSHQNLFCKILICCIFVGVGPLFCIFLFLRIFVSTFCSFELFLQFFFFLTCDTWHNHEVSYGWGGVVDLLARRFAPWAGPRTGERWAGNNSYFTLVVVGLHIVYFHLGLKHMCFSCCKEVVELFLKNKKSFFANIT